MAGSRTSIKGDAGHPLTRIETGGVEAINCFFFDGTLRLASHSPSSYVPQILMIGTAAGDGLPGPTLGTGESKMGLIGEKSRRGRIRGKEKDL